MWGGQDNTDGGSMNPWNTQPQAAWPMGRGSAPQPTQHTYNRAQWPQQMTTAPQQWSASTYPQQQPQWHTPVQPQAQWSSGIPSSPYVDQSKKMHLPVRIQQHQQPRYDLQPALQQWNAGKVDQGTPWDTNIIQKEYGQWNTPPPPHQQQSQWSNEWQNATSRRESTHHQWQPHILGHSMSQPQQQWQQNSQVEQAKLPIKGRMGTFDSGSMAAVGPWVAPQGGVESGNDMFWQDPNPKNKRAQRDIGTSYWGDPGTQMMEIRRWKEADHEDFNRGPTTSTWNQGGAQPTGWGDLPPAADQWRSGVWEQSNPTDEDSDHRVPIPPGPVHDPNVKNVDINQLTQQIAEQLRRAVNKGYIKQDIINQQLSQEKLVMLNNLLQRVYRMEQAEAELEHLQRNIHRDYPSGPTMSVKQECDRLYVEIEQLKLEMNVLTSQISQGPVRQTGAGSRLQQWRKGGVESGLDQLIGAVQNMGVDDKASNWTPTTRDWANPPPVSSTTDVQNDKSTPSPVGGSNLSGPQEFIPGKKWEWNDPNKLAEDPLATPSNINTAIFPPGAQMYWNGQESWKTDVPSSELRSTSVKEDQFK